VIRIVPQLLKIIKLLEKFLFNLKCFLINRYLANSPVENPVREQYRQFQADIMPVMESREILDYIKLIKDYKTENGKPLKPINRRGKHLPPEGTICPFCNAPYEYIGDNSGGRGQLYCKVCKNTFHPKIAILIKLFSNVPSALITE